MEHHGTNTPPPLATGWRENHLPMRHLHGQKVSNGKPCEAHHIPEDICAMCKGAAEERKRIIEVIKLFRDDFKKNGLPSGHLTVIIDSIERPE